jgi:sugar phosphate isomerase/epimerase
MLLPRRTFLRLSALAGAGLAANGLSAFNFMPPTTHLGLQLYSLRDDMARDPAGTLRAVAEMGYREVEGFGYADGKMFGMSVAEFSKLLRDLGLTMPASHCMFGLKDYDFKKRALTDQAKKAIDDAARMGQQYVVCPWMEEKERPEIARLTRVYTAAGRYARKAGLRFAYHNHDFEFLQRGPDQRLLIEWLLREVSPKYMRMEMDFYWVRFAGHNPLDWFRRYPGRWVLCHLKDMADTEKRETIEVGDGTIDFGAILELRKTAGLHYYIVELEHYRTTPLEGVKRARENFLEMPGSTD